MWLHPRCYRHQFQFDLKRQSPIWHSIRDIKKIKHYFYILKQYILVYCNEFWQKICPVFRQWTLVTSTSKTIDIKQYDGQFLVTLFYCLFMFSNTSRYTRQLNFQSNLVKQVAGIIVWIWWCLCTDVNTLHRARLLVRKPWLKVLYCTLIIWQPMFAIYNATFCTQYITRVASISTDWYTLTLPLPSCKYSKSCVKHAYLWFN